MIIICFKNIHLSEVVSSSRETQTQIVSASKYGIRFHNYVEMEKFNPIFMSERDNLLHQHTTITTQSQYKYTLKSYNQRVIHDI